MSNYFVNVEWEDAMDLTRCVLIDDYENVCKDIAELKAIKKLSSHQQDELERINKLCKALKRVIRYYSVPDTMEDYFKEVEDDYFGIFKDANK